MFIYHKHNKEKMKKISICVPCYNEEKNIESMYRAITEQMQNLKQYDYEIIFADNSSTDNSQGILRDIAGKDKKVKVILNQINVGIAKSSANCMSNISGDATISIPCDFQEPPEMIPEFIEYWEKGYDIVWGQKIKSKENAIKYLMRSLYYKIINWFSDYPQLAQVTGYGIMDRSVIDTIMLTRLQDPFVAVRHLISEYGFKIKLIPYTQQKRMNGESSYNLRKYFEFAILSLFNTSTKPLRMMTVLGLITAIISMLCAIVFFIYKLTHWNTFQVGISPLVIGLFFCSSVQLFGIGILGEYISIILRKVTKRTLVVEKEKINFENE